MELREDLVDRWYSVTRNDLGRLDLLEVVNLAADGSRLALFNCAVKTLRH